MHYKATHTNITIKKRSNHSDKTKAGIIKGYVDRAKSLCDENYLNVELRNITEVFNENGYTRAEIESVMTKRTLDVPRKDEKIDRGIVVIPNIPNFSQEFNKIARRHGFRVAHNTENRVKDLLSNAKTPLGDKKRRTVYNIPCKCRKFAYTGETDRQWRTRKKEHQDKVRLTKQDISMGNIESAENRMNTGDGGLARHCAMCESDIDWENAKIVGCEKKWKQRKYLEGIETLRKKNSGISPLNAFNQLEQWQPTLYSLFNT